MVMYNGHSYILSVLNSTGKKCACTKSSELFIKCMLCLSDIKKKKKFSVIESSRHNFDIIFSLCLFSCSVEF